MRLMMAIVALALLAVHASASVDTVEQAKAIVQPYFKEAFRDVTVLENPAEVEGARYWVFYAPFTSCFPFSAKTKLLAAVDADTSQITCCTEASARTTQEIARIAFENEFMSSCLAKNQLSFTDLINDGTEANAKINSALTTMNTLSTQVDAKGYALDLRSVERELEDIRSLNDELINDLDTGNFELIDARLYLTQEAMHNAFLAYNDSFAKLDRLIAAVEAYNKHLDQKVVEATNSKIPFEDKKNIVSELGAVRDLGKYDTSYRRVVSPVLTEFNNAEANFQSWAKASDDSFAFLKAKGDAEAALAAVEPSVQSMLSNEADVKACGVDTESIRKEYNAIRTLLSANQRDAFDVAVRRSVTLSGTMDEANEKYQRCVGGAPSGGTQKADYGWLTNLLIIGIIIAIAFVAYKKRQEQIAKEDADL